ncbi:MAG: glutamate 5-kinase [Clostridia bacterium]|nr:glutamate 5-kinase [Clostridia bacterium]
MKERRRIVVKVGTSTLTYDTGKINLKRLEQLVRVLADLMNMGLEVILVSSGAIGVGVGKLGLTEKPSDTRQKQALAAIGQASLMSIYEKYFKEYGYNTGQVLLTKFVLEDEQRYVSAKNAFETMIEYRVIPIVNENDVISTYEIEFGDNDTLSAYVANLVDADLLVILSDIDGFYDGNPNEKGSKLIPVIEEITEDIRRCAGGVGTRRGTGGMQTKLHAAELVLPNGIDMIIANGDAPDKLYEIVEGKSVGTLFVSKAI